jgi:2-methylcitrate dehydratase PrpD
MGQSIVAYPSQTAADFIHDTSFKNLPQNVIHQAKLCLLDWSEWRWRLMPAYHAIAHETIRAAGEPQVTLWGFDRKVRSRWPRCQCCIGPCDRHGRRPPVRQRPPGVVCIPPAVALAEHADLTGRELIRVRGRCLRVFIRIGSALNPELLQRVPYDRDRRQHRSGAAAARCWG